MENLKSVLTKIIEQSRPYLIVGGSCFVAGVIVGIWL
jgi:hypothetical protein